MTLLNPDVHRLIILPDHRQVEGILDTTNSTFTQYGAQPGEADAQQDTEMSLETSGSQSDDATLEIRAEKGGFPGRDSTGAGIVWRQDGDDNWRGFDVPQPMFGIEAPSYNFYASVRNESGTRFPDGVVTSTDKLVTVTCDNNGTTSSVYCRTRSVAGAWTDEGPVHSESIDGTHEMHPCLTILPSGRILCFHWTYDATAQTGQVSMEYSDDEGTTWATGNKYTLPDPLDTSTYAVEGMRVANNNGQICLTVILSGTNEYRQYASDSLGADFTLVETTALSGLPANCDVAALPGGVGFILSDNEADIVSTYRIITIGSAFQLASTGSVSNPGGSFSGRDGIQFAVDDNGSIYAYGLNRANEFLSVAVSYDEGGSWTVLGDEFSYASAISTYAAGHYPDRYSAVFQRGRTLLLHNFESTGGTYGGDYDNSFMCSYHGGYTDVTMPPQVLFDTDSRRGHWLWDWIPYNLPGDMGWTAAGAASTETPNVSDDIPYLDLATAAGNARTYEVNVAGPADVTLANGMGCTTIFSEQDHTGSYPALQLEIDDASDEFQVEVRMSGTTLMLWDVNGAAQIGSTATITADTYYQIKLWLKSDDGNTGEVYCWYREWDTDEDREWEVLASSVAVVRGAAGPAQRFVCKYGHIAAGAAQSEWVQVSIVYGEECGTQLAEGQTSPDELALRRVGSLPVYIDDGVKILATDGPAFSGNEWQISTRYKYPWHHVMPTEETSPNTVWRSKDGSANQDFVFDLTTIAGEGEDWNNDLFALVVLNTNAYRIRVDYETTPGGGYSNLVNSYMTATCEFTRAGKSVEITRHGIGDDFNLIEDELVGCEVVLDTAGGQDVRHVTRNTYGYVPDTVGTTNKRPRLYCDDIDGTEATSGTCTISFPSAVFVQSLRGIQIATLRVRFEPNPYTAPDYLQCGTLMFGPGYILGWQPSQTRGRTWTPNVEVTTGVDGRRSSRRKGPIRRTMALTWTEGVDESMYLDGDDDVIESSYTLASAEVVAERHDVPHLLMGMWDYLDGPNLPVFYAPKITKITSTSGTVRNRYFINQVGGGIYGRIQGELDIQTLLGEEDDTEVLRVGGLTIEEEI